MALTPSLDSVEALYRKLERESYRAYHSRDKIHKADHFYNFCITAHSMRDFFLERKNAIVNGRDVFEAQWKNEKLLITVNEIANSAKHFTLRDKTKQIRIPKTRRVRSKLSVFIEIYANGHSDTYIEHIVAPDIAIVDKDNQQYDLYEFTEAVLKYWRNFLVMNNIRIRRQSIKSLIGKKT